MILLRKLSYGLIAVVMIACHSDEEENHRTSDHTGHAQGQSHAKGTEELEIFEGTGTVISIPPSKRHVIVRHGDIPGFMSAMTMPLTVSDTTVLNGVSSQDSIRFEIESRGNEAIIRTLEIIEYD